MRTVLIYVGAVVLPILLALSVLWLVFKVFT